ncbi:30S ribosomal protein S4 chloroplastic [Bienertia sinuspersici]
MADDLVEQCLRLRMLEEEEDVVDLREIQGDTTNEKLTLTLVGRLLTCKPYNFEAMQRTLKHVWMLSKGAIFRSIENNRFIIQFFHWKDKEKILVGAPWSFDQQLIILKEIEGTEQPDNIDLNCCPF